MPFEGVLGAAASYVFGEEAAEDARHAAQRMWEQQYGAQKEFAQKAIQWKVQDAKKAGLHPLYALGGATPSFTPIAVMPDESGPARASEFGRSVGAAVGRSMSAQESEHERQMKQLQLAQAQASVAKDHAMEAYYQALAHKAQQDAMSSAPMPVVSSRLPSSDVVKHNPAVVTNPVRDPGAGLVASPLAVDAIEVKPDQQTSSHSMYPSRSASTNPFLQEWRMDDRGRTVLLPRQELGEILESAPVWVRWPIWWKAIESNLEHWSRDQDQQRPAARGRGPTVSGKIRYPERR